MGLPVVISSHAVGAAPPGTRQLRRDERWRVCRSVHLADAKKLIGSELCKSMNNAHTKSLEKASRYSSLCLDVSSLSYEFIGAGARPGCSLQLLK